MLSFIKIFFYHHHKKKVFLFNKLLCLVLKMF